jgi:beta-1,4-mannosyl-glycoprotein beta-1,4-N-acetylglucosaminyltransferase
MTQNQPPIVDCTLFHREEAMLRARLSHLRYTVDATVIVEASTDHAGKPNTPLVPVIMASDEDFFKPFSIHHVTTDLPKGKSNWPRVWAHRNAVVEGLDNADIPDEALVLLSDIDEFPRKEILWEMRRILRGSAGSAEALKALHDIYGQTGIPEPRVAWMLNKMFYYDLWTTRDAPWLGTRITTARDLRHVSPEVIRRWPQPVHIFHDAGWHFSYFGGVKAIQEKIAAIAESTWLAREEFLDEGHLLKCIAESKDLYNRDGEGWYEECPPEGIPQEIIDDFGFRADVLEPMK